MMKWWIDGSRLILKNDEMMKWWARLILKNDEMMKWKCCWMMKWWNIEIKMMNRIRWMMKWWNGEIVYVIETIIQHLFWWDRPGPGKGLVELAFPTGLWLFLFTIHCWFMLRNGFIVRKEHTVPAPSRASRRNLTHVLAEWIHILLFNKLGSSKNSAWIVQKPL